jgi:hypothetical protein
VVIRKNVNAGHATLDAQSNGRGGTVPRGKAAEIGDTNVAKNGYHYTRVEEGWKLTHWITAEKMLGRPLEDNEMVQFIDKKFKRDPYNAKGIRVIKKKTSSVRKRIAQIDARIEELQAEKANLEKELNKV